MRVKNPHAVALGKLGGAKNKGIPKPKSAANLEIARRALLSGGFCSCGRSLSVRNKSGICRECQRKPKSLKTG